MRIGQTTNEDLAEIAKCTALEELYIYPHNDTLTLEALKPLMKCKNLRTVLFTVGEKTFKPKIKVTDPAIKAMFPKVEFGMNFADSKSRKRLIPIEDITPLDQDVTN